MTMLDEDGYHLKCDRCKKEYFCNDENWEIQDYWDRTIFYRRHKPRLGDFCLDCAKAITPLVHTLRDIDELKMYVNKLGRAINEKRRN